MRQREAHIPTDVVTEREKHVKFKDLVGNLEYIFHHATRPTWALFDGSMTALAWPGFWETQSRLRS